MLLVYLVCKLKYHTLVIRIPKNKTVHARIRKEMTNLKPGGLSGTNLIIISIYGDFFNDKF